MKKIIVEIEYDNVGTDFNAKDVEFAIINLFGLNAKFRVKTADKLPDKKKICKRISPRIKKFFPLTYTGLKEKEISGQALSKNVSTGGIKILSHSYLAPLAQLTLTLPVPKNPCAFEAKVIWCRKLQDSPSYDVGLKFLEIPENKKRDLKDLVQAGGH
jgi:c-di-GMP-binding flagellar brake protein YcgR